MKKISAEQLVGEELAEWYALTPMERWRESAKLWEMYLSLGGSLDPELDTQSPFFDPEAPSSRPVDGRSGLRVVPRREGASDPKTSIKTAIGNRKGESQTMAEDLTPGQKAARTRKRKAAAAKAAKTRKRRAAGKKAAQTKKRRAAARKAAATRRAKQSE